MPTPRSHGNRTLLQHIESLGIQTFGKERENPNFVVRRIVLNYHPLLKLCRVELPVLFGRLLRDEGTVLDRYNPNLFDDELDSLLAEYGPLIWPDPGTGSRDHLRDPQKGTLYTSDLIYPRDLTTLKEHLRGVVLCKQTRPDTDIEAYINKTHSEARRVLDKEASMSTQNTAKKRTRDEAVETESRSATQRTHLTNSEADDTSESEDSVLGTKTRRQTRREGAHLADSYGEVELRLYRKTVQVVTPSAGPTWSCGNLMLSTNSMTSEDCFARICEKIDSDCSFVVFQLPEDMSTADRVRIDRGSQESETAFQRVWFIIQKARKFPCGPPHRSVEVEIGLDIFDD